MFQAINKYYFDSFRGLQKEVWYLALITLINRTGTMVIPFLSIYLSDHLGFDLEKVGWIMMAFGAGSVTGSWIGGRLSDSIGDYRVMYLSLGLSGLMFIVLQFLTSFWGFLIGVFVVMTIADSFRPAIFVALKKYSNKESQTRSVTLIRLAINLGFSMGPALGGIIISTWSYSGLFWIDGITCIIAMIFLLKTISQVKGEQLENEDLDLNKTKKSIFSNDKSYLLFLLMIFLMAFVFMQMFTTVPVFYKEFHGLSEAEIGMLLSINGILIFLLEMPLVRGLESRKFPKIKIIQVSLVMIAVAYPMLNMPNIYFIPILLSLLLITFGEMFAFPFTNSIALSSAPKGMDGKYMAYYSIAFSSANLLSAKTGFTLIDNIGYGNTWYIFGMIGAISVFVSFIYERNILKQ